MNKGVLYAIGVYLFWGLSPIYWRSLHAVPALEILAQRIAWSLVVLIPIVVLRGRWPLMLAAARNWRVFGSFMASALLLAINWLIYIWSVNAGFIVETSLGYFINPLVNVALGILFLRERLRLGQGVAIAIALGGVVYLTVSYGQLPWIALTLASTFGIYGLLRKTAALPSLDGLTMEALVLFVPAVAYLVFLQSNGQGALGTVDGATTLLLVLSGVITTIPLLMFAAGARLLSLTTMGLIQYISPTMQLLLGVFMYGEHLSAERLIGFCLVWLALAIFTAESMLYGRRALHLRTIASKI